MPENLQQDQEVLLIQGSDKRMMWDLTILSNSPIGSYGPLEPTGTILGIVEKPWEDGWLSSHIQTGNPLIATCRFPRSHSKYLVV